MKKHVLLLGFFCLAMTVSAQFSSLIEVGKSGIGVSGAYENGNGFDGFGGTIGYSYKGIFDVEAYILKLNFNENQEGLFFPDADPNVYSNSITGKVTWWMLRKTPTSGIDVNVGLRAEFDYFKYTNYQYLSSSTTFFDTYESFVGGRLGLTSNLKLKLNKNWYVLPGFTASFDMGKEHYKEVNFYKSSTYHGMVSSVELTLGKHLSDMSDVYITVTQISDTYDTGNYYKMQLGYVYSF